MPETMRAEDGSGKLVPAVQEYVLNTYERYHDYNVAAAESYWAKTESYWAAIREEWDEVAEANGCIRIEQEPNVGTSIARQLRSMADAIKNGKTAPGEATEKAVELIAEGTVQNGG